MGKVVTEGLAPLLLLENQMKKPKRQRQIGKPLKHIIKQVRSFTSFQMVHTHTHPPAGGWDIKVPTMRWKWRGGKWDEVKMTMRWKLLNQGAKRGTQKKRERANTNTWNLAQNGQPWKGKGKKSGGRRKTEQDQRRRGRTEAPEPTWHGENLQQPQHATGQTYLERGERKNTWNRDPWGTS